MAVSYGNELKKSSTVLDDYQSVWATEIIN